MPNFDSNILLFLLKHLLIATFVTVMMMIISGKSSASAQGWRFEYPGKSAHCWGKLLCPEASREGHIVIVNSTPRNPENHAKKIRRKVDDCNHIPEDADD